ncbi:hypothetical protein LguiB_007573 [Lonicera macranthoides]
MSRAAGGTKGGKGKKGSTFTIDCGKPVEDKIMEIASCGVELGVHLILVWYFGALKADPLSCVLELAQLVDRLGPLSIGGFLFLHK